MPFYDEVILLLPTATNDNDDEVILLLPFYDLWNQVSHKKRGYGTSTPRHLNLCNPTIKDELSCNDETTDFHKPSNTRKCGQCGVSGHYKNNCPVSNFLPKKKTSTWNMTHKTHAIMKYTCECGKKEMNKCNLDRHKKNHHGGLIHLR